MQFLSSHPSCISPSLVTQTFIQPHPPPPFPGPLLSTPSVIAAPPTLHTLFRLSIGDGDAFNAPLATASIDDSASKEVLLHQAGRPARQPSSSSSSRLRFVMLAVAVAVAAAADNSQVIIVVGVAGDKVVNHGVATDSVDGEECIDGVVMTGVVSIVVMLRAEAAAPAALTPP